MISGVAHEVDAERCAPAVLDMHATNTIVQERRLMGRIGRRIGTPGGSPNPQADVSLLSSMAARSRRYEDCLSASWLAARLAVDPVQLDAMRREGELIAVRKPGSTEWLYPSWQYSGRTPLQVVPRLVRAAREAGVNETRLYEILTAPLGLGGRRRLADLVVEGRDEEVVEAVRSATAR